ncbi:hypothetical protein EMIT0215P_30355 [Pseudomonas serboccidentalis]
MGRAAKFQMRDLRAKAGTDKAESSGDILQARDQLGHTTVVMTEQYIRNRKGKKVMPTKRIANQVQNCGPETNKGLHQLSPANP